MTDIAAHIRIFDSTPTDDLVEKRTASLKDIQSIFTKKNTAPELFQVANNLACIINKEVDKVEDLVKKIETAIRNKSKAFSAEGQELQLSVCAQLAAIQLMETTPIETDKIQCADVIAIGLWSALTFQAPQSAAKLESLRLELLQQCQRIVRARAEAARKRIQVPNASFKEPEEFNATKVGDAFKEGLEETINALRINAAIDREEIDLLWWVLAGWSKLLDRRFSSSQSQASIAVASGLEVGKMLRSMPVEAHFHLALRHVNDAQNISLIDLLIALGDDIQKLAASYIGNPIIEACPEIFPLLTALTSRTASKKDAKIKHSLHDWAARAMLESAALHVTTQLPRMIV